MLLLINNVNFNSRRRIVLTNRIFFQKAIDKITGREEEEKQGTWMNIPDIPGALEYIDKQAEKQDKEKYLDHKD